MAKFNFFRPIEKIPEARIDPVTGELIYPLPTTIIDEVFTDTKNTFLDPMWDGFKHVLFEALQWSYEQTILRTKDYIIKRWRKAKLRWKIAIAFLLFFLFYIFIYLKIKLLLSSVQDPETFVFL